MKNLINLIFIGLLIPLCHTFAFAQTVIQPIKNEPQTTSHKTANSQVVGDINSLPLFNQAKAADPERYQFAVDKGAQFIPTSDGKSFYVLWTPTDFDKAVIRPMIVTLHGHSSWAFDEFYLWQQYAEGRGYGIIALQWWFGGGEATTDYYTPQQIYPIFENELNNNQIEAGKVLFHGFSRGSANSYAVTALDRQNTKFFLLTISNASGAMTDYPPNIDIINGIFGEKPFTDAHWVMYCGGKDPNPDRDGCPAMMAARDFVTGYGATVDLLIEDTNGDHGGFHQNSANVNAALDWFAKLLNRKPIQK